MPETQPLETRGVVLTVDDLRTLGWPLLAAEAGLTTIGTHVTPAQVSDFIRAEAGQAFIARCAALQIAVEHELHAMSDLLPRDLFAQDPSLFRMNEAGERTPDWNCCVHSPQAIEIICENAVRYTEILRPTTGRYFFWIDDGRPMCRCPRCRAYSDSEQALILENALLGTLRRADPRATLAHLAYLTTMQPPTRVQPEPGIFLEFAPIERASDIPLSQRDTQDGAHGQMLDLLDANLEVFGREDAQVLEYWLDVSRFSRWQRPAVQLPWHGDIYRDDVATYRARGIRHLTSFAAWIDADYVRRFGLPPLGEYGRGLG